jgi:hypothetical protein
VDKETAKKLVEALEKFSDGKVHVVKMSKKEKESCEDCGEDHEEDEEHLLEGTDRHVSELLFAEQLMEAKVWAEMPDRGYMMLRGMLSQLNSLCLASMLKTLDGDEDEAKDCIKTSRKLLESIISFYETAKKKIQKVKKEKDE